jgi:hypothetical protein
MQQHIDMDFQGGQVLDPIVEFAGEFPALGFLQINHAPRQCPKLDRGDAKRILRAPPAYVRCHPSQYHKFEVTRGSLERASQNVEVLHRSIWRLPQRQRQI